MEHDQLFLGFQLVSSAVPHDLNVVPLPSFEIIWEMSVGILVSASIIIAALK